MGLAPPGPGPRSWVQVSRGPGPGPAGPPGRRRQLRCLVRDQQTSAGLPNPPGHRPGVRLARGPAMMGPMGGDGELAAGAAAGCSYALLADGTTITIRPARPGDYTAVRQLHEAMSPANQYLRFFSLSRQAGQQEASRLTRAGDGRHAALLGFLGAELAGVASYEQLAAPPATAEVAFAVADRMHGR